MTCRVPFAGMSEGIGGFITYPDGQRQDDPSSAVALPGNQPNQAGQNPGLAYDRVLEKWVPVPLEWLAPGGQTYAYLAASKDYVTGQIRAVTVADGSSGDVTVDGGWELVATTDTGVYVTRPNTPGAWFVPFGSVPTQVVDHGSWQKYFNGALWGIGGSGQLINHDLTSNAEVYSASPLSSDAYIAGFTTSAEAMVIAGGSLLAIPMVGPPATLWPASGDLRAGGRVYADSLGVWFEVYGSGFGEPGSGVHLWTSEKGVRLVSPETVHVSGPCA